MFSGIRVLSYKHISTYHLAKAQEIEGTTIRVILLTAHNISFFFFLLIHENKCLVLNYMEGNDSILGNLYIFSGCFVVNAHDTHKLLLGATLNVGWCVFFSYIKFVAFFRFHNIPQAIKYKSSRKLLFFTHHINNK